MKNIQDILKKKAAPEGKGEKKELDEKTIARVFLEAAKGEIKNLENSDMREIKLKDKILYVKTIHPVVSSELLLRKESILAAAEELLDKRAVDDIKVYS